MLWLRSRTLQASLDSTSTHRIPQLVSSHLLPPATVTDAKAPCCPGSFSGPSARRVLPLWVEPWQSAWRAPPMRSLRSWWQASFTPSLWHGPGVVVGLRRFWTWATWILPAAAPWSCFVDWQVKSTCWKLVWEPLQSTLFLIVMNQHTGRQFAFYPHWEIQRHSPRPWFPVLQCWSMRF